ncbi:MAG TPA: hypothetical protein PLJ08_20605, partial [Cyclobacteriaceae bacterium]|nr:hypothetical protein [Cyclobacteriaceae bacterium]
GVRFGRLTNSVLCKELKLHFDSDFCKLSLKHFNTFNQHAGDTFTSANFFHRLKPVATNR